MKTRGFTLLETLMGVVILSLTILAPFTLAHFSLRSASLYKNQAVAFHLAQEAIEYVRNRRDNNSLAGAADWLEGLGLCRGVNGCEVDIPNNAIFNCNPCRKIKYDSASGFYNYSTGVETLFVREVKLSDVVGGREARIVVTVSWQERLIPESFTIQENIFNWR
jgi:prepilin-type N-terminal cleavage/methylation domain-containing protein